MPQANTPIQTRRAEMPLAGIQMDIRNVSRAQAADGNGPGPAARFELVFAAGAPVRRYDWANDRYYFEQLDMSEQAVNLERLQRGAPLLNTHSAWSLEDQIGVVENPVISQGMGTCQAQLSRRESVKGIVTDLEDRVIRNVSVGYSRDAMVMTFNAATNIWTYLVTRWTAMEVSLVPIPADMDSQVRSVSGRLQDPAGREVRSFPCDMAEAVTQSQPLTAEAPANATRAAAQFSQETPMLPQGNDNGGAAPAAQATPAAATEVRAAPIQADAHAAALAQSATRAADITDLCVRHGATALAAGLIRANSTVDQARTAILDSLATRDAAMGGQRNVRIEVIGDEMQTRMAGIEQAILHRVAARTKLDDNGRQYRGMSLLELGRDFLEASGVSTRGMDRLTLATRMLHFRYGGAHGTSDFSSLFANVANNRLRMAYEENAGTYDLWARRAPNAPDFKNLQVTALSGAPELLQTNEHGEFKYGTMADGAETYKVITYGRIVSLTRQAIINDDLRAFDRLVSAFGSSSRRLENRLVYAQLTDNAALSDSVALFHATHGNLATGGGSALTLAALSAGRAAMRLQKGAASELLNITPSYLIVPTALEGTAHQLTSANYVASTQSDTNEFRAGGRTSVEPIVEPLLDATSATGWYLAASNGQVDTVEYCYLDGAEGPTIETEVGFETDGISYKCREDFAAKAIDYRGLYRANGA